MEPLEYLRILRRRWRILAACVLVAGLVAWITTPSKPSNEALTYTATHQLLRDSSAVAPPALASLSIFVKTGEVPQRVAERLDYPGEPAILASGVTLEPDEQVGTLGITASGASPSEAADRANAFAEETLAYLGEESQAAQQDQLTRLNEQLANLQVEIDDLERQVSAAEESGGTGGVLQAQRDSKLRQYGAALDQQQQLLNQPPPSAGYITLQEALPELADTAAGGFSAPRSRPARTAIAVVLGAILGLAAVLIAERLDTRLNTREEVQSGFGLPVIAEVPRVSVEEGAVVSAIDPVSSAAEAYRTLRASLVLIPTTALGGADGSDAHGGEPQVILVTSPAPGDGKTTTVANLAACFAEAGRSVLVLGCDFRRPEIHKYFDVDPRPGIADVLMDARRDLASVVRPTNLPGVSIAASGSSLRNFGDVANAGRALVDEARGLADVVIIDTAPLLATNDATELIPAADAVVLVARVGKTSADSAKRTRILLERLAAPAAGIVLIGVSSGESSYAYYYTSKTPDAPKRRGLLRRARSNEISDRIEPWRGAAPPPGAEVNAANAPDVSTAQSARHLGGSSGAGGGAQVGSEQPADRPRT